MIRRTGYRQPKLALALALLTLLTGIAPASAGCLRQFLGLQCCCVDISDTDSAGSPEETTRLEQNSCCCCTQDPPYQPESLPKELAGTRGLAIGQEEHSCTCLIHSVPTLPGVVHHALSSERTGQMLLFGPPLPHLTLVALLNAERPLPSPPQPPVGLRRLALLCAWLN